MPAASRAQRWQRSKHVTLPIEMQIGAEELPLEPTDSFSLSLANVMEGHVGAALPWRSSSELSSHLRQQSDVALEAGNPKGPPP